MPKGRISYLSPEPLIADSGEAVAIKTRDTTGVSYTTEGAYLRDIIYVYDRNGNELFSIPSEGNEKNIRAGSIDKISPSGGYLAVTVKLILKEQPDKYITWFYDLKKNTFWDSNQRYDVLNIENDGMAKVGYFDANKGVDTIDLKKYLEK